MWGVLGGLGLPRLCAGTAWGGDIPISVLSPSEPCQHLLCDRNPGGFCKELCVGRNTLQWDVNIKIVVFCASCHFSILAKESEKLVSISAALTLAQCPSSDVSPRLPQEMLVPEQFKIDFC